jgi:predicted ATPase
MLNGLSQHRVPESLVNLIFEESQGNPFFVEEVYRHLIEEGKVFDAAGQFRTDIEIDEIDVPENVRLIIGRRLERLDQNEKRVLAAAAVIGRSFSFELLTATSQIDVDELFTVIEKAQQMGIIVPSSEGPDQPFTFTHELVRQTLLAGISAPRRQWLHAGVVDAIELVYPGAVDERAGEIADHLLKAGSFADRQTPIGWLRPAGKGAFEAAAFEQAQRSFRSAVSHQGAAGFAESADSADLLANLAMAERGLRRRAAGLANLREALEIYLNLGDREMIGRGLSELTDSFFRTRPFQEAAETARRRLAYVGADVSADRARLPAVGHTLAAAAGCERPMRRCGKR